MSTRCSQQYNQSIVKQISTEAYQALRDALAAVTWNKRPFETLLRTALRDTPELLAGLNFGETKREVADALVDRLVYNESKYQDISIRLMLEVASMSSFPNLEQIKDADDREIRLGDARRAVAALQRLTEQFAENIAETERQQAQRDAARAQAESVRKFGEDIEQVKQRFIELQTENDKQKRGYAFESLLADLFLLFDLEPRMAYSVNADQIDGSFTFEGDDFIVEARWRKEAASREHGDVFAGKVGRKGKNALGLFVSVNGFKPTLIEQFKESTSFITMDGTDLFLILDQRIRLDDVIRIKRRHANETGSCHLPVSTILT